jgi:hypothetical protein
MPETLPEKELPLGWNALLNHEKKTGLVCGEYRIKGKAFSFLEVVNKPTKAELDAHIEGLGYTPVFPSRPTTPPAEQG